MYQPFAGEIAGQHRSQLVHEADVYRLTKQTRAAKASESRTALHRIVVSAVSLLAWPIKH